MGSRKAVGNGGKVCVRGCVHGGQCVCMHSQVGEDEVIWVRHLRLLMRTKTVEPAGEVEVGEPPKLAGISLITGSESYVSFSLRSIW